MWVVTWVVTWGRVRSCGLTQGHVPHRCPGCMGALLRGAHCGATCKQSGQRAHGRELQQCAEASDAFPLGANVDPHVVAAVEGAVRGYVPRRGRVRRALRESAQLVLRRASHTGFESGTA
eukprot:5825585-Prymnesium_polylepis.1